MTSSATTRDQHVDSDRLAHLAKPLVSVGIPTYNRAPLLRRAIESVLDQDYDHIELIISDNASTDDTQALCEEFCRRDSRVQYYRQPVNLGLTANFTAVFEHSSGQFYKWLADDDWIDQTYISHCVRELLQQPELAVVCGLTKWYSENQFRADGSKTNLLQHSGKARVLAFYRGVRSNEAVYGLMRRDILSAVPTMANVFGADWFVMASIAFKGKIKTIETTTNYQAIGGASASAVKTARLLGLPWYQARLMFVVITLSAFKDIAWASPAYEPLGRPQRFLLASHAAAVIMRTFLTWIGKYYVPNYARQLRRSCRVWVEYGRRVRRAAQRIGRLPSR